MREREREREREKEKGTISDSARQIIIIIIINDSSIFLCRFTIVGCANALFLFFLSLSACLIVVVDVCYYTKDVVCLSIKDINLLIKETGRQPTTTMYVYANARR